MKKTLLAAITVLLTVGLFIACDGSSYEALNKSDKRIFTVTFDSTGGTSVPAENIESGNTVSCPDAPSKTGYVFGGWYKESECSNAWNFSTDVITASTTIYAMWNEITAYKITRGTSYEYHCTAASSPTAASDFSNVCSATDAEAKIGTSTPVFGDAGGYVFYKLVSGTDGYAGDYTGCSYLEVAAYDASGVFVWGNDGSWGTSIAIGKGKSNTQIIINNATTSGISNAATASSNCNQGGKSDWFLPSYNEIEKMEEINSILNIGDFYWSSTESSSYDNTCAWHMNFNNGMMSDSCERSTDLYGVRPIRAF